MVKKIKIFDCLTLINIQSIFSTSTEIFILEENLLSRILNFFKIKKISNFKINLTNSQSQNIEKFTSIFENDEVGNFVYEYLNFINKEEFKNRNLANFVIKFFCNNRNLISFMSIENFLYLNSILEDIFKQNKVDLILKDNIFKNFIRLKYNNNNINYSFYKNFNFLIVRKYLSMIKKSIYIFKLNKNISSKKICIMDSYPIHRPNEFFSDKKFIENAVFISNEKIYKENIFYIYNFVNFESIKSLLINILKKNKFNNYNILKMLYVKFSFEKEIYKNFFEKYKVEKFYSCHIAQDFTSSAIGAIHDLGGSSIGVTYSYSENYSAFQNIDAFDYFISFNNSNYKSKKYSNLKQIEHLGYLLDYKFKNFKLESQHLRDKILKTEAKYIIGLFDQGSNDDDLFNYINHVISKKSYTFLIEKILNNQNYALIIKPKKPKLLKQKLGDDYHLIEKAKQTGRFLIFDENDKDHVKNFKDIPAKIAMICDITIHDMLLAGTAGVESALNGTKSIYFDYYNLKKNQFERDGLNIVFRDWNNLWKSIENDFKNKKNNLGSWTNIIGNFDKYRDGKTNQRVMNFLNNL